MKVVRSNRISKILKNEAKSRKLLCQLVKNDKLDGGFIETDFGFFKKI